MPSRASFVGREAEVAQLAAAVGEAAERRGGLHLLVGEAGIGKTRLAREAEAIARGRGVRVVWGRCHEGAGAPPLWPWAQAMRSYVEALEPAALDALRSGPAAEIGRLVPALRAQPTEPAGAERAAPRGGGDTAQGAAGGDESATLLPEGARFSLFDGLRDLLVKAVQRAPLMLILDDLHWADLSSLALLRFVAGEIADIGVLVLATYRDAEPDTDPQIASSLASLARLGSTIALHGLPRPAVATLLAERLGTAAPPDLVDTALDITGGNPFLVGEVTTLLDPGRLSRGEQRELPGRLAALTGARDVIERRLAPLAPDCRALLANAAVVGRDFELSLLGRVVGSSVAELLALLAGAVQAGVVKPIAGTLSGYEFSHALLREALYGSFTPVQRCAQHRAVAAAVRAAHADDLTDHLAELSHHGFEAAKSGARDDLLFAIEFSRRAGARALRLAACEEAIVHFERCLRVTDLLPGESTGERVEALLGLAEAQRGLGEMQRSEELFGEALERARALGPELFARAVRRYGAANRELGLPDERLVELIEEALQGLPDEDSAVRAVLMSRLAAGLHLKPGEELHRQVLADAATDMARRLGDRPTLVAVLVFRLAALLGPDTLDERLAISDEIVALADQVGDRWSALVGLSSRVHDLLELADRHGFDRAIDRFAQRASDLGDPFWLWQLATFRCCEAMLAGRFDAAEGLANDALAAGQRAQNQTALLHYGQQLFKLRGEQDRTIEVEPLLRMASAEASTVPAWRCSLANLYSVLGRLDEAQREYDALAAQSFKSIPRDTSWIVALYLIASVCVDLDDRSGAARLYAMLLPFAGMIAASRPAVVAVGPVDEQLARLAATLGRFAAADDHFAAALETARRMGGRPWIGHIEVHQAQMLQRRGEPGDAARAARLLEDAARTADELGMPLLRRWVGETEAELDARGAADEAAGAAPAQAPSRAAALERAAPRRGILRREGDVWTLGIDGRAVKLKHSRGLAYIAHLVTNAGREFTALEMVALEKPAPGGAAAPPRVAADADVPRPRAAGMAAIDARARGAYRSRLTELRDELEEARAFNDLGRAERAQRELEALTEELARSLGIGGRARQVPADAERARSSVWKAIRQAIERLEPHDAQLAEHFAVSVKTGRLCCYAPPSRERVAWAL